MIVTLKQIAADLGIDPREARAALRSLAKRKKLSRAPGGRWEWRADQAKKIKRHLAAALGKPLDPPSKLPSSRRALSVEEASVSERTPSTPLHEGVMPWTSFHALKQRERAKRPLKPNSTAPTSQLMARR